MTVIVTVIVTDIGNNIAVAIVNRQRYKLTLITSMVMFIDKVIDMVMIMIITIVIVTDSITLVVNVIVTVSGVVIVMEIVSNKAIDQHLTLQYS